MTFLISLHVIFCILLIIVILIQAGRGGGLVEMLSGVESMFGTKTNALLTRATTILSIAFFITCLSLALLSAKQSRSLMRQVTAEESAADAPLEGTAITVGEEESLAGESAEESESIPSEEEKIEEEAKATE